MTSILAKNEPMTEAQFNVLVSMYGNVQAGIMSPGLVRSKDLSVEIQRFQTSNAWKQVTEIWTVNAPIKARKFAPHRAFDIWFI